MAWDKEKDRALAERAKKGRRIHDSSKKGTYVATQGFARKPRLVFPKSKLSLKASEVSPPKGPDEKEPA